MIEDIFEQDVIRDAFKAWKLAKGVDASRPPKRSAFDPVHCHKSLAHMWIYERVDDKFICVLAGETVNDSWGKRILGKNLVDVIGVGAHPAAVDRFTKVLSNSWIVHGFHNQVGKGFERKAERFYAPLTGEEGENAYVLGVSYYYNRLKQFGDEKPGPNQTICDFLRFYDSTTFDLKEQLDL